MRVNLMYFKPSGKWYASGEYEVDDGKSLIDIWRHVRAMRDEGRLPGLMPGRSPFIVAVDVPKHPHRHPHLVML